MCVCSVCVCVCVCVCVVCVLCVFYCELFGFQQFCAHKTVLSCTFSNQDWDVIPPSLTGQSPEVLQGLLHYLYSGSLPMDLSEDTCKQLLNVASQTQALERLGQLCAEFLEATALKNSM